MCRPRDEGGNTLSNEVKVTIVNVDEDGVVTFSHTQPEVGARLTATLTDPDRPSRVIWQWYRGTAIRGNTDACDSDTTRDCRIGNATSASYTPVADDDGQVLTATVTYTDGQGSGKSAEVQTSRTVQPEDGDNVAPQFIKAGSRITTDTREIEEGADLGRDVGDPVEATDKDPLDADNGALVYTLSGTDAASFSIDNVGQITNLVPLDFETKKSYRVTVKAVDPSGDPASINITINVTDVDESPVLSKKGLVAVGSGHIGYEENGRGVVAEYTATVPSGASVSWSLGGPDGGDFSIGRNGQLTFRRSPNFEAPADANRDNTYEITVTARAGRDSDQLDVTVNVTNLDETRRSVVVPDARHRRRPSDGYIVGRRRHANRRELELGDIGGWRDGMDQTSPAPTQTSTPRSRRTWVITCGRRPTTTTRRAPARASMRGRRQRSLRTTTAV